MPDTEDIFIQTFNGFDVWINGRAIYFSSSRAKELLAILVHKRGGSASLAQLAYLLYEETPEDTAKQNIHQCKIGLPVVAVVIDLRGDGNRLAGADDVEY